MDLVEVSRQIRESAEDTIDDCIKATDGVACAREEAHDEDGAEVNHEERAKRYLYTHHSNLDVVHYNQCVVDLAAQFTEVEQKTALDVLSVNGQLLDRTAALEAALAAADVVATLLAGKAHVDFGCDAEEDRVALDIYQVARTKVKP